MADINALYQQLFGREADQPGAQYWQSTGLTGDALKNAMIAGAQGADLQAYQKLGMAPQTPITPIPFNPFDPVDPYVTDDFVGTTQPSTQPVSSRLNDLTGGITSLPGANTTVANPAVQQSLQAQQPNFEDIVTKAYESIGRSGIGEKTTNIDQVGLNYWTGQLSSGAISPDQFKSIFLNAAAQNKDPAYEAAQEAARNKLVADAYSSLGRSGIGEKESQIDKEGWDYWTGQLKSGAITPEQFRQVFNTAAEEYYIKQAYKDILGREAEDLGLDYWKQALDTTNKEDIYRQIAGGATTGKDVLGASKYLTGDYTPEAIKRYTETEEDLLNEYETFREKGIDPTKSGLDANYFSNVADLYGSNVDKTITDILGADAVSAFTPEQKQTLVNNLVSGDATREDVAKSFQNSTANKKQEAARIANLYASAFGGSQDDAQALYAKLIGAQYTGPGTVSDDTYTRAKTAFDKGLTSESESNVGLTSLLKEAAKQEGAENRKFFQDNPELFLTYDNLEVRSDDPWAKYGEIHNAAIYDANAVDKYMEKIAGDENLNSASSFAHRDTRRLGIDTGGIIDGGSGFIKRGADVLGLTKEKEYISGNEGEQIDTGKYVISGDINKAAQQAGIDPSKYQDKYKTETRTDPETGQEYKVQVLDKSANEQIYDAINEKYKDLYIIGNVNPDNPNDKSQNNFMYTPYKRTEDGKLIAIAEPTLYTGAINPDVYKKKGIFGGGFLGDFAQGIASIPFVAEIAAATIPGMAAYYPALKAAQTAAFTTDFGDIAKTGGIAALGQYGAQYVSPYVSETLGTGPLATNLATGATLGAAGAGIMGQDIGKGALTGAAGAGLAYGTNQLLPEQGMKIASDLGIDPKYQSLFANTLARLGPTILTGGKIDPTKLLMSYAMNKAMKEGKEQMRTA